MHLETIKHLRGLAVAYDDLVPIAKPLLLDLLDSYEKSTTTESPPVNTVTPANPVPAPETFDAHGHTWTRHTPGDPCPVPASTKIIVLLRGELNQLGSSEVRKAGEYAWSQIKNGWQDAEVIGWRYAEPQPSTPDK